MGKLYMEKLLTYQLYQDYNDCHIIEVSMSWIFQVELEKKKTGFCFWWRGDGDGGTSFEMTAIQKYEIGL